jgi:general secretion pathway protein M
MNSVRELWEKGWDHIAASSLGQRVWAYYEAAPPREQLALKVLGAFLLVLLVLLVLVCPLHEFNKNAVADYRQQQETLAWMQANRGLIGSAGAAVRKPEDSLLSVANQSARSMGLSFKRYEPNGEKGLNLWLEKVSFNQVITWLATLERDYGVVTLDFSASRREEPGLVDVRVVLEG